MAQVLSLVTSVALVKSLLKDYFHWFYIIMNVAYCGLSNRPAPFPFEIHALIAGTNQKYDRS